MRCKSSAQQWMTVTKFTKISAWIVSWRKRLIH
jgi:hypothetical protein